MKRQDKIDLILVLKRSIGMLEKEVIQYICISFDLMESKKMYTKEVLDKARDYLFSEIPMISYNKTFYEHENFFRENPYYKDGYRMNKSYPWWIIDMTTDVGDISNQYGEVLKQRILFLRILIDKLNK